MVIAKIDATANDLPPWVGSVNSFPTLMFYRADDKANPVVFTSLDRSLSVLLDFVKTHTSRSLDELRIDSSGDLEKDEL